MPAPQPRASAVGWGRWLDGAVVLSAPVASVLAGYGATHRVAAAPLAVLAWGVLLGAGVAVAGTALVGARRSGELPVLLLAGVAIQFAAVPDTELVLLEAVGLALGVVAFELLGRPAPRWAPHAYGAWFAYVLVASAAGRPASAAVGLLAVAPVLAGSRAPAGGRATLALRAVATAAVGIAFARATALGAAVGPAALGAAVGAVAIGLLVRALPVLGRPSAR